MSTRRGWCDRNPNLSEGKLQFIQATRGIAAMLVVYYHTVHAPVLGEFGVDIFFVLSGFIMAMLMEKETSPTSFLKRRLIRIFPLYFIFTTLAAAISWLFPYLRKSGDIPTAANYLLSIMFVPNRTITGGLVPVLNPGWTLNYEMLFYFVCCVSLAISYRLRHALIFALLILAGSSGVLFGERSVWREFSGNRILLEFLAGIMVWLMVRKKVAPSASLWPIAAFLILIAVMGMAESHKDLAENLFGDWSRPAIYLLPAAFVIYIGYTHEASFNALPCTLRKALVRVGDASYAIYLTHVFVLGLLNFVLPRIVGVTVTTTSGMLLALVAAAFVGVIVHEQIDSRIQQYLRRRVRA